MKSYKAPLNVTIQATHTPTTPIKVQLDFAILADGKWNNLVDPYSIMVKRVLNNQTVTYPVQFDEHLFYGNTGWIAWLCDEPKKGGDWSVEFKERQSDGRLTFPNYLPMVGVGDELYLNSETFQPICIPGLHTHPIAVDWDGDGQIDLLSTSHYSNVSGMPWSGIFFWKNIGTNDNSNFGVPLRLYADGVCRLDESEFHWEKDAEFTPRHDFISEYYIKCDVFDWFKSGKPDLITCSRGGGIKIYRNLGTLDKSGMPKLKLAVKIKIPKCVAPASYIGFKVIDWDRSGRGSFLLGVSYRQQDIEYGQLFLMKNSGGTPENPQFDTIPFYNSSTWKPGQEANIIDPDDDNHRTYNNMLGRRCSNIDFCDVDNDGQNEILLTHLKHRPVPIIEVWKNVGSINNPVLRNEGGLKWTEKMDSIVVLFLLIYAKLF